VSTSEDSVRVPSQERAIRTRASLVDAAKAEFSQRGYASTTAKSIAERAGVSTGSFYQYFRDKDQVLYELADDMRVRVAQQLFAHLESEGEFPTTRETRIARVREEVRALVDVIIAYHRDDPGLHAVLTERRHADPVLEERSSRAESILVARIGMILRALGSPGDIEATSFVIFGLFEGTIHAHVLGKPVVDDDRLIDAIIGSVVRIAFP